MGRPVINRDFRDDDELLVDEVHGLALGSIYGPTVSLVDGHKEAIAGFHNFLNLERGESGSVKPGKGLLWLKVRPSSLVSETPEFEFRVGFAKKKSTAREVHFREFQPTDFRLWIPVKLADKAVWGKLPFQIKVDTDLVPKQA